MKIISILLVTILLFATINIQAEQTVKTIYVDDILGEGPNNPPEDFTSIQDAIDASNDGDVIYVYNGTYYENIIIFKSITLQGEDRNNVIIDGEQYKNHIRIEDSNVNVNDISITNCTEGGMNTGILVFCSTVIISNCNVYENFLGIYFIETTITISNCNIYSNDYCGIYGVDSKHTIITDCSITNNTDIGTRLTGCSNALIHNNTIKDNKKHGLYLDDTVATISNCDIHTGTTPDYDDRNSGGIFTYHATLNILNCSIHGNYIGMRLYSVNNTVISNCSIYNNKYSGIAIEDSYNIVIDKCYMNDNGFMEGCFAECINIGTSSYNITITNSTISNNTCAGIYVSYDTNIFIHNNTIKNNKGRGIVISNSEEVTVTNNVIHSNGGGVFIGDGIYIVDNKDSHLIKNNEIISNQRSIYIESCIPNKIIKNNFINNTHDVLFSYSHPTRHIFRNNYWSQKIIPIGPKIILGCFYTTYHVYTWINFDWFPARHSHIFN